MWMTSRRICHCPSPASWHGRPDCEPHPPDAVCNFWPGQCGTRWNDLRCFWAMGNKSTLRTAPGPGARRTVRGGSRRRRMSDSGRPRNEAKPLLPTHGLVPTTVHLHCLTESGFVAFNVHPGGTIPNLHALLLGLHKVPWNLASFSATLWLTLRSFKCP